MSRSSLVILLVGIVSLMASLQLALDEARSGRFFEVSELVAILRGEIHREPFVVLFGIFGVSMLLIGVIRSRMKARAGY